MKLSKLALCLLFVTGVSAAQEVPKHLQLARELLETVKPENNAYNIKALPGAGDIRWKGDFMTSENSINTMCVGFVNGVLDRARSKTPKEVRNGTQWSIYPRVNSYFEAVEKEIGMKHIKKMDDIEAGDIFVFSCVGGCATDSTNSAQGHITIVDVKPTKLDTPGAPLKEGTFQWKVTVIDTDDNPHGKDDTRYTAPGEAKKTGIGRGSYFVYADANGVPVGYINTFRRKFFDVETRKIAFGRPQY